MDGYDERLRCTDLVLKSLEKVTLPDLPNVEKTVKSMAEELKNDVAQFASSNVHNSRRWYCAGTLNYQSAHRGQQGGGAIRDYHREYPGRY